MIVMNEVFKNNRAWHTRDAEVGDLGFTFELSAEQKKREEEMDQDMAHIRTHMDLLTKHIMAGSEKVNAVGASNWYEDQDIDLDEKAKFLSNQGVSRIMTQETKVGTTKEKGSITDQETESRATSRTKRGIEITVVVYVIDEGDVEIAIEERFVLETLTTVIMNFEDDLWDDYVETRNALQGMETHSYVPKKLDLDLKNRPNPPTNLSIEEPPVLEL
uniref:Integrase core domain containing protein n=1 Tax=Solanum tuberosum TaxID=4113 RepID=M1DC26_SOLTU